MPRPTPKPAPRMADTFKELLPGAGPAPDLAPPAEALVEVTGQLAGLADQIAVLDARAEAQSSRHRPTAHVVTNAVVAVVLIVCAAAVLSLYLWLMLAGPPASAP